VAIDGASRSRSLESGPDRRRRRLRALLPKPGGAAYRRRRRSRPGAARRPHAAGAGVTDDGRVHVELRLRDASGRRDGGRGNGLLIATGEIQVVGLPPRRRPSEPKAGRGARRRSRGCRRSYRPVTT
jgi:hypothetical protein